MTINYNDFKKHGFDIIPPENVAIRKNKQGFWRVYYQSHTEPTEWIEDLHEPEIKTVNNKEETIYRTTIGYQEGEASKTILVTRTEKENGTITHDQRRTHPKEEKNNCFGTQPPESRNNYEIQGIEDNLEEITNWKSIARIINEKNPFYYDHSGMWWRWNHTTKCWEGTDETDLLIIIDKVSKKNTLGNGEKNKALEAFKRIGRTEAPVDNNDYWVQFGDTIVDVSTGERFLASPRYFITNPVPWKLGTETTTPIIDALLKEWAGDKAHTLKQILAYSALPYYAISRIFFLLGNGSNGKSTYLALLRYFIGQRNLCSVSLDAITNANNKFAASSLYKKLVCQMGETNFAALQSTAKLKQLSGRDLIEIEFKGKTPFEYINYAKIIIASNTIPETHDKTDGFFRRFVVVDFPNQYTELRDVLAEVPDEEYNNLALWCVAELKNLLVTKSFYMEGSISDRRKIYEKQSDPLTAYITDMCERNDVYAVSASQFYAEYEQYLTSRGMRVVTYRVWRAEMEQRGYIFVRNRFFGSDNAVSSIVGIRRKTESADNDNNISLSELSATVSVVSDTSLIHVKKNLTVVSDTTGTTDTNQDLFIKNLGMTINRIPNNNSELIHQIFGYDRVRLLLERGDIIEIPRGSYRFV